MSTVFARPEQVRRDWYVVDATGKTLGRLATQLAMRLRGKHKPEYTPHVDTGDHIIVLNADKVRVTGAKLTDKIGRTCVVKDVELKDGVFSIEETQLTSCQQK